MPVSPTYRAETIHARLGGEFFDPVAAARFPRHILRYRNTSAATSIGVDTLSDAEWLDHFGCFSPLPGNLPTPLALRYHGHQFQSYNPNLGDGRGFLFAQVREAGTGRLLDLGTKGSGRTPWSRAGDGRLTLKGGVREVLATSLLEALGVETSKSLSLIETGEALTRGDEPSPTRSSVLVRLSHSHIRIGTFQRFAFARDDKALAHLIDHTLLHYETDIAALPADVRVITLFARICQKVARMGAQWMAAGFVHGVLNTDNINITGESFDYGPWRFLPHHDGEFVAAYFDDFGLYAYARQPAALHWNLARLAECLLPFAEAEQLSAVLARFEQSIQREFGAMVVRRLGLQSRGEAQDSALAGKLFAFLDASKAPFEQAFFDWFGGLASESRAARSSSAALYAAPSFAAVRESLSAYEPRPDLDLDSPYFAANRPCTLLIDEVEAIWAPIARDDDWRAFNAKLADIGSMRGALGLN